MLLHSLGFFCLLVVAKSQLTTSFGSCSRKCADDSKDLNVEGDFRFPCSCHPSCRIYKDCCYDSPYRNESLIDHIIPYIQCLPVDDKGHFAAIGSCVKFWKESSKLCRHGFGHLPPVTSLKTGVTYTNLFCAICNEGSDSLSTWNVETVCNKLDGNDNESGCYISHDRYLWRISIDKNNSVTQVPCKYVFHEGQEKSLNNFEMHHCRGQEIGKCSRIWEDNDVLNLCLEYLDPVYIGDKVYRNLHCAACNYEKEGDARCIPSIVKQQQSMNLKRFLRYCTKHRLGFRNLRGHEYSFHTPFKSNSRSTDKPQCTPPPGSKCCESHTYDENDNKCRKHA